MKPLPPLVAALCLILYACTSQASKDDEDYLRSRVFPLLNSFRTNHGLDFPPLESTNSISHLKIETHDDRTKFVTTKLVVDRKHSFFLLDEAGVIFVMTYQRHPSPWGKDYSSVTREARKAIESLTNHLNDETALALAEHAFRVQGHDPKNFMPVKFKQMIWTYDEPLKTNTLKLPYYEAEWFRKDADLDAMSKGDIRQPSVRMVISGETTNLCLYGRMFLSRDGTDWGTNRPPASTVR